MGRHKKVNGKHNNEMLGIIELWDGLDLKKTISFTNRARRREIMQQWTNDIKNLKGYFYFIITLD